MQLRVRVTPYVARPLKNLSAVLFQHAHSLLKFDKVTCKQSLRQSSRLMFCKTGNLVHHFRLLASLHRWHE
jgi:hypothetical protein